MLATLSEPVKELNYIKKMFIPTQPVQNKILLNNDIHVNRCIVIKKI